MSYLKKCSDRFSAASDKFAVAISNKTSAENLESAFSDLNASAAQLFVMMSACGIVQDQNMIESAIRDCMVGIKTIM